MKKINHSTKAIRKPPNSLYKLITQQNYTKEKTYKGTITTNRGKYKITFQDKGDIIHILPIFYDGVKGILMCF